MKVFLVLALAAILFNGANGLSNFGRLSPKNIPVKLFQNLSIIIAEEVVKSLFLLIALVAILFIVAESFEQFLFRVTQETFLYNISKSIFWFRRSHLKFFLFLALSAILFNGAERFEQFW